MNGNKGLLIKDGFWVMVWVLVLAVIVVIWFRPDLVVGGFGFNTSNNVGASGLNTADTYWADQILQNANYQVQPAIGVR